jgi:hypothetical protein
MRRVKFRNLLPILLIHLLAACGDDATSTSSGAGQSSTPPSTTGAFVLANQTGLPIDVANISLSSEPSWGDNLLSATLVDGASQTFSGYVPGTYDGRAVIFGTYSMYFGYSLSMTLTSGQTITVNSTPSAYSGSLKVVNNSSTRTITAIYVSPVTATTWGTNQITSSISPSGSMHFYDVVPGTYDIKVVWNSGSDSIYPSVNVSYLSLLTQGAN